MAANIRSVNDSAQQATGLTQDLQASSGAGNQAVIDATTAMFELEQASTEMGEIVKVISAVAAQTNLPLDQFKAKFGYLIGLAERPF